MSVVLNSLRFSLTDVGEAPGATGDGISIAYFAPDCPRGCSFPGGEAGSRNVRYAASFQ